LEKVRLAKSIELKNNELTKTILNIQGICEAINASINQLEENQKLYTADCQRAIKGIIHDLRTTLDEKGWKEFELVF